MKIDLHVHARERSLCSIAAQEEIVQQAIDYGLDALVFTDHHALVSAEELKILNDRYKPFKVFSGIEIRIDEEDLLVLGVDDPILEEKDWSYPELHQFVKENDGFIALAHPYRYRDEINIDIENYIPDAIEFKSSNIIDSLEDKIKALAERLNTKLIANSDAHDSETVGKYYNQLSKIPKDDRDFVKLLKEGMYTCYKRGEEDI